MCLRVDLEYLPGRPFRVQSAEGTGTLDKLEVILGMFLTIK